MKKNYLGEPIPDFKQLSSEVIDTAEKIIHGEKYHFTELFFRQPSGYYEKNLELFEKIGFNNRLKESDPNENEIKGIYIFYENDEAQYIGISRKLIRRLRNHFLGKTHFEASLSYLVARHEYDNEYGDYMGIRKDFPFEKYRTEIQKNMIENWKIEIIPETDNYKLYYLELILACKLKTKWNSFETH